MLIGEMQISMQDLVDIQIFTVVLVDGIMIGVGVGVVFGEVVIGLLME